MAKKSNVRNVNLGIVSGTFTGIFRRLRGEKRGYDFSGISALRQLLSDERARLLHITKTQQPTSLYNLAKLLGRDFKSVRQDVKLLEKFGFLELNTVRKGKREMLKPVLVVDSVNINISI